MTDKIFKKIYLSIADFVIEIVLLRNSNIPLANEYFEKINRIYNTFLIKKKNKIDLQIIIKDSGYILQTNQIKKNKQIYLEIAQQENKTTYSTSYTVSMAQFFLLLNKLFFDYIKTKDCFTFHSSAIYQQNHTYLFTGNSTAGKSTMVELIKNEKLLPLCDDYGFVRKIDRKFYFYPSGIFEKVKNTPPNCKYEIMGIYLIHKSKVFHIDRIDYSKNKEKLLAFIEAQTKRGQNPQKKLLKQFLLQYKNKFFDLYFEKKKMNTSQTMNILNP